MLLNLALAQIGPAFDAPSNPRQWTKAVEKHVYVNIANNIVAAGSLRPRVELQLLMMNHKGPLLELAPLLSVDRWLPRISCRREERLLIMTRLAEGPLAQCQSPSGLGRASRRTLTCVGLRARPRREVGKGIRVCSRVACIGGARAIASLYFEVVKPKSARKRGVPVADRDAKEVLADLADFREDDGDAGWDEEASSPQSPSNKGTGGQKGNALPSGMFTKKEHIPEINSLAVGLSVTFEAYFPDTYTLLGSAVAGCSLYRVKFKRMDVIRLVESKEVLLTIMKSTDSNFYDSATEQDVAAAEQAWGVVLQCILAESRWVLSTEEYRRRAIEARLKDVYELSFAEKVRRAESLLTMDADLVVDELGGRTAPYVNPQGLSPLPSDPALTSCYVSCVLCKRI